MLDTLVLNMPPLPNEASVEFQVNFKTGFIILFWAKSPFKKEIEGRNGSN